jgi:hypothetical protein
MDEVWTYEWTNFSWFSLLSHEMLICDVWGPPNFGWRGESTLQWPKNVVTNSVFQNYELSTSTKPILKEVFIIYTQNKVV